MRKELSDSQKVKRELTKRFPDLKFSVTGGYATHTAKIDVAIVEIKNSFINPVKDYDHGIGFVDMENGIQYNGLKTMDLILRGNAHARYGSYTGKIKKVIDEIFSVIEKFYGTYRPGDSMIDKSAQRSSPKPVKEHSKETVKEFFKNRQREKERDRGR